MYGLNYWNGKLKLGHAFLHVYVPLILAGYAARAVNNYAIESGVSLGQVLSWALVMFWLLIFR